MENTSLASILSGNRPEPVLAPEPPAAPAPEPAPAPDEAPREPQQDQPQTGDQPPAPEPDPAAPPAAEQDEPEAVPFAALKDERKKRQELERRLQEQGQQLNQFQQFMARYAAQMQQPQQPPQPPPAPPDPDLFQDPDAFRDHLRREFRTEVEAARVEADRKFLSMSAAFEAAQRPDFAEAEAAFVQEAQRNPGLYDRMMREAHPAGFAYAVGKQILGLRAVGPDPAKAIADAEERGRQKALAEAQAQRAQQDQQEQIRSSIPPSLADSRDTSGRFTTPAAAGYTPLKDVLRAGRK